MMIIGILALTFLIDSYGATRVPDVDSRIYSPLKEKNDISFKMKIKSLDELISLRPEIEPGNNLVYTFYKFGEATDLDLNDKLILGDKILKKIRDEVLKKAHIIIGYSLSKWLVGHSFIEDEKGWFKYEDRTGVLDSDYIKLKLSDNILEIIEDKSVGYSSTKYYFKKRKWSKGKLVLESVERKIHDSNSFINVKVGVEYSEFKGGLWLPSDIEIKTHQETQSNSKTIVKRNLEESIKVYDYEINNDKARTWFANKNLDL